VGGRREQAALERRRQRCEEWASRCPADGTARGLLSRGEEVRHLGTDGSSDSSIALSGSGSRHPPDALGRLSCSHHGRLCSELTVRYAPQIKASRAAYSPLTPSGAHIERDLSFPATASY